MALIDECKVAVRTKTTDAGLIAHLQALISTAKKDLELGGVNIGWLGDEPTDPLIISAVKAYVCWTFFHDSDVAEKWKDVYDIHRVKIHSRAIYTEAPDE